MAQCQGSRCENVGWRHRVTLAGQDVENNIGGMDAVGDRLSTGRLDGRKAVGQNRVENVDHLPIAIVGTGELAPYTFNRRRQYPVLERSAVAQGAGLTSQHRHIMPGVVGRLAAAEGSRVLGNDASILTDDNAVGIGLNLDWTSERGGTYRACETV